MVLRPPLEVYDVLIHLNPKQVPLLDQAVDRPNVNFSRGVVLGTMVSSGKKMPVTDYNPVALYLAELRVSVIPSSFHFVLRQGGGLQAGLWKVPAASCQ